MTTHTSHRAAPLAIIPVHHAVAGLLGTLVLVVLMVLVGAHVQATTSPQWSTSTPGQVRLPTPQPLPPVVLAPEHSAQTSVAR